MSGPDSKDAEAERFRAVAAWLDRLAHQAVARHGRLDPCAVFVRMDAARVRYVGVVHSYADDFDDGNDDWVLRQMVALPDVDLTASVQGKGPSGETVVHLRLLSKVYELDLHYELAGGPSFDPAELKLRGAPG